MADGEGREGRWWPVGGLARTKPAALRATRLHPCVVTLGLASNTPRRRPLNALMLAEKKQKKAKQRKRKEEKQREREEKQREREEKAGQKGLDGRVRKERRAGGKHDETNKPYYAASLLAKKRKVTCECGARLSGHSLYRHRKTYGCAGLR